MISQFQLMRQLMKVIDKITNEIALITAVSDLRMFLDIVNGTTLGFP